MRRFLMFCFRNIFKWTGWKVEGTLPENCPRAVMVAGGHTSNWDFLYSVGTMAVLDVDFGFVIKQEALHFPFKNFLLSIGALPVARDSKNTNYVDQLADMINAKKNCYLCIAPEGTRKAVKKWKTGFFHIAEKAKIPIILCYLDYPNKIGHIGKVIHPNGNPDEVMAEMKEYFKNAKPLRPENFLL